MDHNVLVLYELLCVGQIGLSAEPIVQKADEFYLAAIEATCLLKR